MDQNLPFEESGIAPEDCMPWGPKFKPAQVACTWNEKNDHIWRIPAARSVGWFIRMAR